MIYKHLCCDYESSGNSVQNIWNKYFTVGKKKVFERNRCKYMFLPRMSLISLLLLNYILPTRLDHLTRMWRHYTC